jgi:hypothetical protein
VEVEPWRKHLATLLGWASNLISMRRHRFWLAALLVARCFCLEPAAVVRPLLDFLKVGKRRGKGSKRCGTWRRQVDNAPGGEARRRPVVLASVVACVCYFLVPASVLTGS